MDSLIKHENLIDNDCNAFPLNVYSGNPTSTIFRQVYSGRSTHFNKWTKIIDFGLSKILHISDLYSENIHVYNNLCLMITFKHKISVDEAFEQLANITFKINNLVVLNVTGIILYEILRTDYTTIKKINKILKSKKQLIIPLQSLICNKKAYFPAHCDIDISFGTYISTPISNVSVGLTCIYLTTEENNRFKYYSHEYMANQFYFEKHQIENEAQIPISVLLPIETLIMICTNNAEIKAKIEFREFSKSPYNYFSDGIDLDSNNYYLNSLIPDDNNNVNKIPTGKIITKDKNLFIDIKSDKPTVITLIYCCHNYLQICEKNTQFQHLLKAKEHNGNHYPLTKISDNEFIEGYWFAINPSNEDYENMYPKPLPTDDLVDVDFINKLELLTDKIAETVNYLGCSTCRLCNCNNGGNEYILTHNGIKFVYPCGLMHYYKIHHVQPSREFFDFVMNFPLPANETVE
jgi:hypothetical protein